MTKQLFMFLLLSVTMVTGGCTRTATEHHYSILNFGTLIDITLYDVDKKLAEQAFEILQQDFDRYHQHWSPWTDGDLARLNQNLQQGISSQLPDHLLPLLTESMLLSQQSQHYFNPAIGRLINLWQFHKYQDDDIKPPPADQIRSLVESNPRLSDLHIDASNRISSSNPALALSFGAFAKGYAIGLSIKRLQAIGIKNAVINAGGDLSVIGRHGERPWNIGIRHPREDGLLASIEVTGNESVFTSGDYERFYFYQGRRYHHILDPRTGYPTEDFQSVTVIHQDAGRADAAATAIFVAGSENWRLIAADMGIDLVMLVDASGNIQMTPAMQKRLKLLDKSPVPGIIVSEEL